MSQDVKQILDQALPSSWDTNGISADEAIQAGTRRRRIRRSAGWAGTVAGVAAITALAIAVGPTIQGPQPGQAAGRGGEQPLVELPAAIPGLLYAFEPGIGEETTQTEFYTEALWKYLDEVYPDLQDVSNDAFAKTSDGLPEEYPEREASFKRADNALLAFDAEDIDQYRDPKATGFTPQRTGYTQPLYTLDVRYSDSGMAGAGFQFASDSPRDEWINIDIYPAGGFTPGTSETPYGLGYLPQCESYEYGTESSPYKVEAQCEETFAPTGERVVYVREEITAEYDGVTSVQAIQTVVLYAQDGTAVVVRDDLAGELFSYEQTEDWDITQEEPATSFDELARLASALTDNDAIVE